jgi:hypothetical protein
MNEHREYPRYTKDIKIEYSISDSDSISNTEGKIINISLGGMYIITELLVEKNLKLDLKVSFVKDDELIMLETMGTILRSGKITSDTELNENYSFSSVDGKYFAAIKFLEPFIELSLLLQE